MGLEGSIRGSERGLERRRIHLPSARDVRLVKSYAPAQTVRIQRPAKIEQQGAAGISRASVICHDQDHPWAFTTVLYRGRYTGASAAPNTC